MPRSVEEILKQLDQMEANLLATGERIKSQIADMIDLRIDTIRNDMRQLQTRFLRQRGRAPASESLRAGHFPPSHDVSYQEFLTTRARVNSVQNIDHSAPSTSGRKRSRSKPQKSRLMDKRHKLDHNGADKDENENDDNEEADGNQMINTISLNCSQDECQAVVKNRTDLHWHLKTAHKSSFVCPVARCGQRFNDQ